MMEDPSPGEYVTLIVGVEDSESESVIADVESVGGNIEERLPYNNLAVSIEEVSLEDLCSLSEVTSVEIEGNSKTMDNGNFQSHQNMIL